MINHDKMIVIGCSAGGLKALLSVLKVLTADFPHSIIIVQHLARDGEAILIDVLGKALQRPVHEAIAEEKPQPGNIYVAPGDYHLLFELDGSFNLSLDEKVIGSRPSIDVLLETAAEAFGSKLVAVILSGNSADGAHGVRKANQAGARILIQDPAGADYPAMPAAAAKIIDASEVYQLHEIGERLNELGKV